MQLLLSFYNSSANSLQEQIMTYTLLYVQILQWNGGGLYTVMCAFTAFILTEILEWSTRNVDVPETMTDMLRKAGSESKSSLHRCVTVVSLLVTFTVCCQVTLHFPPFGFPFHAFENFGNEGYGNPWAAHGMPIVSSQQLPSNIKFQFDNGPLDLLVWSFLVLFF